MDHYAPILISLDLQGPIVADGGVDGVLVFLPGLASPIKTAHFPRTARLQAGRRAHLEP